MSGAVSSAPGEASPPEEHIAFAEAVSLFRRARLVLRTGWTYVQLDEQPASDLEDLELYLGAMHEIEAEVKDQMLTPGQRRYKELVIRNPVPRPPRHRPPSRGH